MPVYEYKCSDCNSKFDVYHKTINHIDDEDIVCPECNSINNKKLLSSFSPNMGSLNFSSPRYEQVESSSSCSTCGCGTGSCGLD